MNKFDSHQEIKARMNEMGNKTFDSGVLCCGSNKHLANEVLKSARVSEPSQSV